MLDFQRSTHAPRRKAMARLAALVVAGGLSMMSPSVVLPADAATQLNAFVKQVRSATGTFTQSTQSSRGQPAPAQSGTFAFERPGKFRWAVEKPYEQLVLSDGKKLYQYDPDLAQVSVRSVGAAIGNAPAQVLAAAGVGADGGAGGVRGRLLLDGAGR